MNYIADLTGGKAFYNTNDIASAIRKAIDDSSVTYTLGYYAPDDNWNDQFHKLKVKVRRSGVVVQTKKGYFAIRQPAPTPVQLDQVLHEAVWSPLDSTAITVAARIDPSTTLPNASRLFFILNPAELRFQQDNNLHYRGSLDVVFAQRTKRGKQIADFKKTLSLSMTAAQFDTLKTDGLKAEENLPLNPDTDAVRIVVLDRTSGAAGSVTVPVTAQDKSTSSVTPPPGVANQAEPKR
jgi:hypothetical protein